MASEPLDEKWANNAWEQRCRTVCKSLQVCTCNIFGGSNVAEDLEKVAKILTAFFHHEGFLDVVPSDVVAGILLVRMQQRAGRLNFESVGNFPVSGGNGSSGSYTRLDDIESQRVLGSFFSGKELIAMSPQIRRRYIDHAKRRALDDSQLSDFDILKQISHFSVYAMSIYTHLMFMFVNPCSGACLLCHSLFCSRVCSGSESKCCNERGIGVKNKHRFYGDGTSSSTSIRGDNCLGINEAAVAQMTKNINSELVFASFENTVHVKPYAVFIDHEAQKIVITIRGTISLEDWITDGISDSVELKEAGELWGFDGRNRFGHEGFVAAALRIRQELEANVTLKALFRSEISQVPMKGGASIHAPLNSEPYISSRYPLVVVGHSLGAGIAVLLAMFLKKTYPDVHCFGYGMPGAVVDDVTARDCSNFVTSIILGTDMVPRMSFRAMSDLREQVLDAIARARVNKAVIMQTIFKDYDVDAFLHRPGEEPPSKFRTMMNNFTAHVGERAREMNPLFLPGRIIHFVKLENPDTNWLSSHFCCKQTNYKPFEVSWEAFSELQISPTMFIDHFIDRYDLAIKRSCQN